MAYFDTAQPAGVSQQVQDVLEDLLYSCLLLQVSCDAQRSGSFRFC